MECSSDTDTQGKSGVAKGKGMQPKMTEFYQNKKVRQRPGSASNAGDAQSAEKAQQINRKAPQTLALGPEEDSVENEGRDSMSDSGWCTACKLCWIFAHSVFVPLLLCYGEPRCCDRWEF